MGFSKMIVDNSNLVRHLEYDEWREDLRTVTTTFNRTALLGVKPQNDLISKYGSNAEAAVCV
jgi:hypothetical protein